MARLTHVLVFTTDNARMIAFYAGALGYRPDAGGDPGFVLLRADGGAALAMHQVSPEVAAEIALTSPARWREDTALKLCFEVDDLEAARQAVLDHGGRVKEPWSWQGSTFCDGCDVEGNALQLVVRPRA